MKEKWEWMYQQIMHLANPQMTHSIDKITFLPNTNESVDLIHSLGSSIGSVRWNLE